MKKDAIKTNKELSEMSLSELWELFPIVLADPAPEQMKRRFNAEKEVLYRLLQDRVCGIHHVGSTAVGTIKAKPVVDIVAETRDGKLGECADILARNGYIVMSEDENRISLNKGYTVSGYADEVFHIHLRKEGDADEIYFCEYLKNHLSTAKEYEALKEKLLARYGKDRDGYTAAKTDFVKRVTAEAKKEYRFDGSENGRE